MTMERSLTLNPDEEITIKAQTSCLVGKILIETSLPTHLVKTITTSSWRCENHFSISYIDRNTFMFSFENKNDFINVLLCSPWSVNGGLLVLSPWASAKTRHEFHLSRSPFWVQIHGLPIEYLTLKNGYAIGHELGTPLWVDERVFAKIPQWGKVLRVRVSIDVTKPLKKGFVLRRGLLPGVWVDFKYERLFIFCYSCGRIGHMYTNCTFAPNRDKFGPFMRAFLPSDNRYFGAEPRVFGIRSCTDLVVLPPSNSIIVKKYMEVCPRMQIGSSDDCSQGITKSYLWKKFAINSIDSMVMGMNSCIIFSRSSLSNSYNCKWTLLSVITGYLIYLALKVNNVVRGSSFIKGYEVRVPLADQATVAFVEILIFIVLFLLFLA